MECHCLIILLGQQLCKTGQIFALPFSPLSLYCNCLSLAWLTELFSKCASCYVLPHKTIRCLTVWLHGREKRDLTLFYCANVKMFALQLFCLAGRLACPKKFCLLAKLINTFCEHWMWWKSSQCQWYNVQNVNWKLWSALGSNVAYFIKHNIQTDRYQYLCMYASHNSCYSFQWLRTSISQYHIIWQL